MEVWGVSLSTTFSVAVWDVQGAHFTYVSLFTTVFINAGMPDCQAFD